jgi:hypothetical protein
MRPRRDFASAKRSKIAAARLEMWRHRSVAGLGFAAPARRGSYLMVANLS